jgi:transposase
MGPTGEQGPLSQYDRSAQSRRVADPPRPLRGPSSDREGDMPRASARCQPQTSLRSKPEVCRGFSFTIFPPSAKTARRPLPERLSRETVTHNPELSCPECGGSFRHYGEDVSEKLESIPDSSRVIGQSPARIRETARGAQGRRRFHDIHAAHPSPTTTGAMDRIAVLYHIEEEVRGKPSEQRRALRQARAAPLLEELRTWTEKMLRSLSPKSETAEAIR